MALWQAQGVEQALPEPGVTPQEQEEVRTALWQLQVLGGLSASCDAHGNCHSVGHGGEQ
jgi:hypothetical protein